MFRTLFLSVSQFMRSWSSGFYEALSIYIFILTHAYIYWWLFPVMSSSFSIFAALVVSENRAPAKFHGLSLASLLKLHLNPRTIRLSDKSQIKLVVDPLKYPCTARYRNFFRTKTQAFLWASFVLSTPWSLYCLFLRWLLSSSRLGFDVGAAAWGIYLHGTF